MNKKFYWIGLPVCFIVLAGSTYLIPRTYESTFTIAQETEQAVEHNRVMTLNHPENYDLGMVRTDNMLGAQAYEKIIQSDAFLRSLLDVNVCTLDGSFEGSYTDYYLKANDKKYKKIQTIENDHIHWKTIQQEQIKIALAKSIQITYDYETEFVTISCTAHDPLVATMMAESIKERLRAHIEAYQQTKMEHTLAQLSAATAQAEADYQQKPTPEKEAIYKSFARQEVVYKAQMVDSPAFAVLSAPSFSYRKVAPNRWKVPFLVTLLLGLGMLGWEHKKEVIRYLKA